MKPHTQGFFGAKWNRRASLNHITKLFQVSHYCMILNFKVNGVEHRHCPSFPLLSIFKTKQLLCILNTVIQMLTLPVILLYVRMRKAMYSALGKVLKKGGEKVKFMAKLTYIYRTTQNVYINAAFMGCSVPLTTVTGGKAGLPWGQHSFSAMEKTQP